MLVLRMELTNRVLAYHTLGMNFITGKMTKEGQRDDSIGKAR